jgi:hypothetical protein
VFISEKENRLTIGILQPGAKSLYCIKAPLVGMDSAAAASTDWGLIYLNNSVSAYDRYRMCNLRFIVIRWHILMGEDRQTSTRSTKHILWDYCLCSNLNCRFGILIIRRFCFNWFIRSDDTSRKRKRRLRHLIQRFSN